ncbi:MAG: LysR family transcriptional regulator [Minwuia sp.]|nr:LysR family transcriptional regulator [Minwuia sp.]
MNSRQLLYFTSIFEEGTVSRAAERQRVAVSALSHHLANLEEELGQALFQRRPRGMKPTAAGERLYQHARHILDAMDTAIADLRHDGPEIAGDVAIGMAYSAVRAVGVDLFRRVLSDLPKVRLSLSESLSGSTLMNLMASEVDLALVYNPPSDPALTTEAILEERMVCVGKPEIVGEAGQPIRVDELFGLPLILLRQGLSARALVDDAALLKKLEAHARLQMNSVHAIGGCLSAGLGCAIGTPLFMSELLRDGTLVTRPIIEPELTRRLYLCELSDRRATFAHEAIRELVLVLARDAVRQGRWDAELV